MWPGRCLPAARSGRLLAITGSKDVQVDPADIAVIASTVGERAIAQVVPDVDHILRHEPAELSNPKKYKAQAKLPIDNHVTEIPIATT